MTSKYSKKNIDSFNWLRSIPHYLTIFFVLYPFYKLWFRIKVYGRENIPKDVTPLVAANHLSYFDPTIISLALRKPVAYMAKEELFNVPILKQFILMYGAFAVDRKKLEPSTIKTAKALLQKGWYVAMFPVGTGSVDGVIRNIHKGMGYLARTTHSKVLPLAIIGSDKPRGPIIVKIGKPIEIQKDPEAIARNWLLAITELTGFVSKDLMAETQNDTPSEEEASELSV